MGFMWSTPGGVIAGVLFDRIRGNRDYTIAVAPILGVICAVAFAGIKGKDRLPAKVEAVRSA